MAQRSRAAIAAHLLADLSGDARQLLDRTPAPRGRTMGVHDALHARLSAVSRSLRSTRRGIPLHAAACVLPGGEGLLIAGSTRTGKSTLVAHLAVVRGASVLSDDTVWLEGHRLTSIGAPLAIRAGSPLWETALALWYSDGGSRLLVRSADLGGGEVRHEGPVDLLLFPEYVPGAEPELSIVDPAGTFCRFATSLLRSCTDGELMDLALLTGRHPAVVLSYADLPTASTMLDQVVADPPPSPSAREIEWLGPGQLRGTNLRANVRGVRFDGDCALWSPSLARIAHVRGWTPEAVCDTALAAQLRALGLMGNGGFPGNADDP